MICDRGHTGCEKLLLSLQSTTQSDAATEETEEEMTARTRAEAEFQAAIRNTHRANVMHSPIMK